MNGRVNRRDGAGVSAARLNRVEIDTNPAVLSPACAGRRRAPQRLGAIIAAALLALCVALGPGQPATGGATRPSVPVAANANGYGAFSVSRMAARAPVVGVALPSATTGQATDSVPASGPGSVAALAFPAPGDWHTPQPAQPLTAGPQLSAKAAFAVDLTAGVELYADNADQPLPPASLTKIVTALVALRTVSLNDVVTIQASDT
ncbi:MAG TPA: D-alanyl-D-alanine carboxypeptidase, partial [Thermomicrobiaceae bacterium]|nr:D-alanyl-D-alanine carboxypeptidase [Thermomicrobiaceae bacterium]